MTIENLHDFLIEYFTANHCTVAEDEDGLNIQLTAEMDERLLNRPFYWQYVKKLNQQGQPMHLKVTTDYLKASRERSYIYFGTEYFRKISDDVLAKGKYTKLYQNINVQQQTPLYPWLVANIKITLQGKTKQEVIKSIGLNLINGTMVDKAQQWLADEQWQTTIPDYCYLITPLISFKHGFLRIEQYLLDQLQNQQHEWAELSYQALEEECRLLDYFFEHDSVQDQEQYEKERANIKAIYQPSILLTVINGGVFYLR